MRVLIVEDDPSLITALTLVLEHSGHRVLTAERIADAREVLHTQQVDAVLIDAGVQGGGRAFWEELQGSAPYRGRTVLLSGDPARLTGAGTEGLAFAKPVRFDDLLACLDALRHATGVDSSRP